jgi:hypothetical protein
MRITGWAVLAIGVLIAAFGLFSLTGTDPTPTQTVDTPTAGEPGARPFPIATVLIPFAVVAVLAGTWMIVRGGGVIRTRNLAIRN